MEKVKQDRELWTNIIKVALPSIYFINIEASSAYGPCFYTTTFINLALQN